MIGGLGAARPIELINLFGHGRRGKNGVRGFVGISGLASGWHAAALHRRFELLERVNSASRQRQLIERPPTIFPSRGSARRT